MKQVNLTIAFDEEKLTALKRYMSKKELELESGLGALAGTPNLGWGWGSCASGLA